MYPRCTKTTLDKDYSKVFVKKKEMDRKGSMYQVFSSNTTNEKIANIFTKVQAAVKLQVLSLSQNIALAAAWNDST